MVGPNKYEHRQRVIQGVFILAGLALAGKALQLQVIDATFKSRADSSIVEEKVIYPARGLMFDRNGKLLVYNEPLYDLMVTYDQVDLEMDVEKFCALLDLNRKEFEELLNKDWRSPQYSKSVPFLFLGKLSPEKIAVFEENSYDFPGFFIQPRSIRGYPQAVGAHLLGYIREVNRTEIRENPEFYSRGDYIGDSGLEKANEPYLRGVKGKKYVLKDNIGREVGTYKNGELDIPAVSGMDLLTSIDYDLQAYGEQLMHNKAGSIIAIEPETGEILAMVSAPSYDPAMLSIGPNRGKAYSALINDPNQPFFDRAVMAQYPPGSLFKPLVALVAMQEGLLDPQRSITCTGAYYFQGQAMTGCHDHPPCTSVEAAIQYSCNTYFVTIFREIIDQFGWNNPDQGLDTFNAYLDEFGIGSALGIDFPREKSGNYPGSDYFTNKVYKNEQQWYSLWIRSLGIGQGELLMTNLQMANLAAAIGNKGYYYTPHMVRQMKSESGDTIASEHEIRRIETSVQAGFFDPVIKGMEKVVTSGTAKLAYVPGLDICGKTGTAENNQRSKEDHSIFFGFAPRDNPKIAIAVYIENAGWGGSYAAPVASLMIEKYLNGKISPARKYLEQRMIEAGFLEELLTDAGRSMNDE